ncbi:type VI secretion protein [compost metagenome]
MRDFLDLFNDRLQRLLLPVWRKYRYHASFEQGARDRLSHRLFALAGLAGKPLRSAGELDAERLLPYLGLLGLRTHSATLIETVLRYYFAHPELHIEACVERRVDIADEQRNRLGQANHRLGDNLVLGTALRDRSGKFRLHLHQLSWQRLHDFLPHGSDHQVLHALLRLLLRDPLEHDLQLHLRHDEILDWRIAADSPCRLGWTTWLGRDEADGITTLGYRIH